MNAITPSKSLEAIMANINGVSNIDTTNTYGANASKIRTDSSSDFSSYLGESKSLDKIFDKAADKYNIPVELLKAVGKAESNFDANAVSRCGAQGIMQLMPATAKGLGVTNSLDPEQNIMGGAKYLSGLLKKYDGNTTLALAAYNAGSGNVAKYGGVPPFKETQNYVKKILGFLDKSGTDTSGSSVADSNVSSNVTKPVLHVASVTTPTQFTSNNAYLLTGSASDSVTDLESLFTYEDYMKFLDLFISDENNTESKEDNSKYNAQDFSYNPVVLNLLTEQ